MERSSEIEQRQHYQHDKHHSNHHGRNRLAVKYGLAEEAMDIMRWDEWRQWFLCAVLPITLLLSAISWNQLLPVDEDGTIHGNPDLAYHLAIINSFMFGKNSQTFSLFTIAQPSLEGDRLLDPFIPDFAVAALTSTGISLRWSLLIHDVLTHIAFVVLFYECAAKFAAIDRRVTKYVHFVPIVSLYLTISMGGSYFTEEPHYWLHFLRGIYFASRCAPPGYSIVLAIMIVLWTALDIHAIKPSQSRRYLQLAGFMCGLLPYVHPHSFIGVFLVMMMLVLLEQFDHTDPLSPSFIQDIIQLCVPLFLLAVPQLASFLDAESEWSIVDFHLAWSGHYGGILGWLWTSLGLYFPLSLLSFKVLRDAQQNRLVSGYYVFVLCMFLKFQPENVDNMKIFYVWVFMSSFALSILLLRFYQASAKLQVIVGLFIVVQVLPGLQRAYSMVGYDYVMYRPDDVRLADWARNNTSFDSVFLIGTPPPHDLDPILTLAGKNVLLGYQPWLHSRGLSYERQILRTRKVLSGHRDALYICKSYGIDFIHVAGWMKGQDVPLYDIIPNIPWMEQNMKKVYESPDHIIFEVRDKRKRLPRKIYGPLYYFRRPPKQRDPKSRA
eukprot:TRINITY_DN366_c0_g1_i1.p1 TRINITY_DN366_c0_g1~~TRINITY_DN366_c0_g1_i1.p1  ORF type:complete len:607 (+),score=89.44 TRINITY_DN366_c0_g1_i1:2274-4094(+)